MSAYVVDREHIAYLVAATRSRRLSLHGGGMSWTWKHDWQAGTYERAELRATDHDEAVRVGQMLWRECIASVSGRYQEPDPSNLPGVIGEDYVFTRRDVSQFHWNSIEPVEVLKACDCYAYQSCEHEGWPQSEAFAFIEALRNRAWHALAGYDNAPWGAPEPMSRPKATV